MNENDENTSKNAQDCGSAVERLVMPLHGQSVRIKRLDGTTELARYTKFYHRPIGAFVAGGEVVRATDVDSWTEA